MPFAARWPPAMLLRPGALLARLLPAACALCGGPCPASRGALAVVCAACRADLPAAPWRCPRCANPLDGAIDPRRDCGACLARRPAFDATVAAADYAAPLDQLVLQLKFGASLPLAAWFAELLRDQVLAAHADDLPELLCPVPLSARRLAERGFNQALEIARPLAQALGVPLAPQLLARQRDTATQSAVAPALRSANVRGAFAVVGEVVGRHVGVVDDVMTSGHTLDAIAAALKRAGASRVSNFVVARTPPK